MGENAFRFITVKSLAFGLAAMAAGFLFLPAAPSGGEPVPQEARIVAGLVPATPEQLRGVPMASMPYAGAELPESVDLSPLMPPPGQQGNQNSCTAWALAYGLKSYQERVEAKLPYGQGSRLDFNRVFSPAFIYNQINDGRNVPTPYFRAFAVISEQGAATWADMPYVLDDVTQQPRPEVRERAKRYRIDYWRQVNVRDVKELKAHLSSGFPILIGAWIDRAFLGLPAGAVWNSIGEKAGAHAMLVVGYDDGRRAFRLMNSWGTGWADGGFCWADYDHFLSVVNEGYVVKDAVTPADANVVTPRIEERRPSTILVAQVSPNTSFPDRPDLGPFLKFEGMIDIPPGAGQSDQIVVHFFFLNPDGTKGWPVRSLDRQYTDIYGNAACGTGRYAVPPQGLRTNWTCWIPYGAFDVAAGQWVLSDFGNVYQPVQTALLAEATLFVDGFGVSLAPPYTFTIQRRP